MPQIRPRRFLSKYFDLEAFSGENTKLDLDEKASKFYVSKSCSIQKVKHKQMQISYFVARGKNVNSEQRCQTGDRQTCYEQKAHVAGPK